MSQAKYPLESNIDLFFEDETVPTVEGIRQWTVLLLCLILQVLCWWAARRLYRTHRTLTFDCLVLSCEACRLLIMLLYEFAFDHLIMLMLVFLVETLLRAVVCANFVAKALILKRSTESLVARFQALYYSLVIVVIIVLLSMSLLSDSTITCAEQIYSYHWFVLDVLDLLQSLLITISALYLVRHLRH